MCLSFAAKGEIDTDPCPPIQIRKRYNPARREATLELVKPRTGHVKTTFWFCVCGTRCHTDILVCHGCGRHRHHHREIEKAYQDLKKELSDVEKGLKDVKDACGKKDDTKKPDQGCGCNKKEEEKKCGCDKKDDKKMKSCECKPPEAKPAPAPVPAPPQIPFIPIFPGPFPSIPKPEQPPDPKPIPPQQEPPVVNVIVPECRKRSPRHRSSSLSSSSTISTRSIQRVKQRLTGLGRRVWGLEDREAFREQQDRLRQAEDERRRLIDAEERARQRDELARERAREREMEERDRERCRDRVHWRRKEWDEDDGVRILPFPYPVVPPARQHHHHRFERGWPYIERWEGERRGVFG